MTIEEKAGQLYIIGFNGTRINPYLIEIITKWKVGGVVFSIRNVENPFQVKELIEEMQSIAIRENGVPLIVAINQEGGDRTCFLESLSRNPGSMAIGATHKHEWAYQIARIVGTELKALGFNLLFMPVIDLSSLSDNQVLGTRSFGDDPKFVAEMGAAFIRGLTEVGIIPTAKHFPGCGGSSVDAHFDLPSIRSTFDDLEQNELIPFRRAIGENVPMMMTSHVSFPNIDKHAIATFSEIINTNIAREKLGFNGVIITDAFGMKSLTNHFSPQESAVRAILAGADMILKRHGREANLAILQALRIALENGQITEERINCSLKRIFAIKQKYCLPDQKDISSAIWNRDHIQKIELMGEESVTIVRNNNNLLPLKLNHQTKVLLIMPNILTNASLDGTIGDDAGYLIRGILSDKFSYSIDGFDLIHYSLNPFAEEKKTVVEKAKSYDVLILGTHRSNIRSHQAEMVREIFALNKKIIWIALNSPYDLLDYPEACTYICTYGDRLPQLKALCRLITGEIEPNGRLPVSISNLHVFGHGVISWS